METKELSGVLFPNKKSKENHPDYRGKCLIGGTKYRIAGWKRTSKANMPYLSILFQVDDGSFDKPKQNSNAESVKQVAKTFGDTAVLDEEPIEVPF